MSVCTDPRHPEMDLKIRQLELQIQALQNALYAECKGVACTSDACYGGYRQCTGCEARAKIAFGPGWGEHPQNGLRLGESRNLPYPKPISNDDAVKLGHDCGSSCPDFVPPLDSEDR